MQLNSLLPILLLTLSLSSAAARETLLFTDDWKFHLGEVQNGQDPALSDADWRTLDLPHDWSIEGEFSESHPATPGGGALPGGIGWYRKRFSLPANAQGRQVYIDFDGVYMNSEVWINGHYLGKRPYGYASFRYELTPHLRDGENVLAVKVDNSQQPNSRWYSGSGIYRNVWLVTAERVHVDHWGTYITTPEVRDRQARLVVRTRIKNASPKKQTVELVTEIRDAGGRIVQTLRTRRRIDRYQAVEVEQSGTVATPRRWSLEDPHLYTALTKIETKRGKKDEYHTAFGIRSFRFDPLEGFFLNDKSTRILGVCNHHDLGGLGAAINTRALERQLEIMKAMGVNGIRTSHNPPTPELLDLCDRMGFIVMDEAFDMWKQGKVRYGSHLFWDEWHERDLADFIRRDRNHPSIIIWSMGNEIPEQWDSSGLRIARELAAIIHQLDTTRPITAGMNPPAPNNKLVESGALDLIGFNYAHEKYESFPEVYPGKVFLATETTSALATRGHYDMPSDSIRRWPIRWDLPFTTGNPDHTVSAYDNVSAPWGSTHEETWRVMKKHAYLSGLYIWTGFDYLGEPTPYGWPSRSSYFGIVDLAGFPKDAYYLYKSEWTDEPVLHIFPHWNWSTGDTVDVWAYFNTDEVELSLNGRSLGARRKTDDELHVMWRLPFEPGTLEAVGRTAGREVLRRTVKTAGAPAHIELTADRSTIAADGKDLSFITVQILDQEGNVVPKADNLVQFEIEGPGFIAGVDNGSQTSHEPFKADRRKAFNGLALAIVQSNGEVGTIRLRAKSGGLEGAVVEIKTQK